MFSFTANAQDFYGTTDLKTFREGYDKEMRDKATTPLTEEDFPLFKGVDYFPTDNTFRVKANFTETTEQKSFKFPTSSGHFKTYVKVGVLSFKLNNKSYSLSVYQSEPSVQEQFPEYKDLLFIPFKDLTNGKGSYGGGRYIDVWKPKDKEVILDFNIAYNPSCAYGSDRYSCPIPPKENFLKVEIRAGERAYVSPSGKTKH